MILPLHIAMPPDIGIGVVANFSLLTASKDTILLIPLSQMGSNKKCQEPHQLFRSSTQRSICLRLSEPRSAKNEAFSEQSKHQSDRHYGHPLPNDP